jgi:hypothetical protein
LLAGQICFLCAESKLHLLYWLQTEIDEGYEPPDNGPNNEKVMRPNPGNIIHISYLYVPNQRSRCANDVAVKTLAQKLGQRDIVDVQNQAVRHERVHKGLFWHQGVERHKEEPKSEFHIALSRA